MKPFFFIFIAFSMFFSFPGFAALGASSYTEDGNCAYAKEGTHRETKRWSAVLAKVSETREKRRQSQEDYDEDQRGKK